MRRLLLILLVMVASAMALAAGAGAWLLYTDAGLAWTLERVSRATAGVLQLEGPTGTLAGGVAITRVRYADGETSIEARDARLRVSLQSLLALAPRIAELSCEELSLVPASGGEPPKLPASLALPVPLRIDEARCARVVIGRGDAPVVITDLSFAYDAGAGNHRVHALALTIGGVGIKGEVTVGAQSPFPVDGALAAHSAAMPAAKVQTSLTGTLERLEVAASAETTGARSMLQAVLAPFTDRQIAELRADLVDIDLHAFDARLPRTALGGRLALAGAADALAGTLEIANALAGTHDRERLPLKSLRASVRTDMTTLELGALEADLGPAGRLSGNGKLALTRVAFALRARDLNLAGIHTRLRRTQLTGRIDLAATMTEQSVDAALVERGINLDFNARRSGDLIDVQDARARTRGAEARLRGRVTLAGAQPFNAEGTFKAFDPAAWGDFPAGALNGRFSAKGTLKDRRIVADVALEPSRLRGESLAGTGRAEMSGERITANVDLDLGGNRFQVSGAFGERADALTITIDAPRLAIVDPRLAGRVSGTALVTGEWRAPDIKFELAARDLALAEWRAASVTAKGVYATQPDGPLELAASLSGIAAPGWRIDSAGVDVKGTRAKHTAALVARGGTLDLTARAAGGWQPGKGWAGTIQELVNRGSVPVVLEAPVALEAGPNRLRVGAVAARIIGGRLDVRDARYESGRLASEGRFEAIPARTVLALAGVPAESGGTLTIAGAWSLTATPRLNGTISMRREAGDLTLGAGNNIPLGLDTLTVNARIVDDRVEFQGATSGRVASGKLAGSVQPVTTADGVRIAANSPLQLTGDLEIARLAALSSFVEATLRFDGRARATVTARGTLREPLLTGIVEASDLTVAYPPEGVDLRNGSLRAELAEREIRVQSFSMRGGDGVIKASGVLAQGSGRRSTLDWQAERLALTGRPDRRLIVTGRGNAALEDAKLSLTGELKVDSGNIALGTSELPTLGDDVVIVGRKPPPGEKEKTSLRRATLDLSLDLGDNTRITGRGLDAYLAGRLRVQTNAVGNLVARGEVSARRGVYVAFGQRLEIERGRLIFDGPVENPRLDIRAMRKKQAVEAGVEVLGTVRTPFVRVVSDPPLPESEALSWLVLGHGPRDASNSDLAMLPLAAAALLNKGDSPTGGIASRFGLDSIGMRNDTVAGQFITVGKRISDDVYVIFEQGMGATAHVLKLEYNLTQRWLLRAEAGTSSALGVFFRWAFD